MPEQFYSEDGVDRWIAENLHLPTTGKYVDVGCAHPFQYSNTAFLRARGWHGIAIDGTPEYRPEWKDVQGATFINAVISDQEWVHFLNEKTNALVSRIHPEGEVVNAVPLQLLIGGDQVDFMSIDIEGAEADVLKQYFQGVPCPKILVCEFNSAHKGRDPRVFNILIGAGMTLVHLTDSNAVFTS
jgi:FkbM family methyltransferase